MDISGDDAVKSAILPKCMIGNIGAICRFKAYVDQLSSFNKGCLCGESES